jgi:hypothetical protein
MEHFNQYSMKKYTPKNIWVYNKYVNECFTLEQFEQLEECYDFSGEIINIHELSCDMYGDFHFDFDFKGVKFEGTRKLDSVTRALWSDETREWIEFEMCLELLSHDAMNDVYENHELYK